MKNYISILLVTFILIGCGEQSPAPSGAKSMMGNAVVGGFAIGGQTTFATDSQPYLAYEHTLALDVSETKLRELYVKAQELCLADKTNQCVLLDARLNGGRNVSAELKFRAKPAGIQALIKLLSSDGEITTQSTHIEDLAKPIQDSTKRLDMLKDYQTKLNALKDNASKEVDSLIKVTKELATVQSDLESAKAENDFLMQRVNTEILNVYFTAQGHGSFLKPITSSLADFGNNFSTGIATMIASLAFILPWLFVILLFGFLGRFVWKRCCSKYCKTK